MDDEDLQNFDIQDDQLQKLKNIMQMQDSNSDLSYLMANHLDA